MVIVWREHTHGDDRTLEYTTWNIQVSALPPEPGQSFGILPSFMNDFEANASFVLWSRVNESFSVTFNSQTQGICYHYEIHI